MRTIGLRQHEEHPQQPRSGDAGVQPKCAGAAQPQRQRQKRLGHHRVGYPVARGGCTVS